MTEQPWPAHTQIAPSYVSLLQGLWLTLVFLRRKTTAQAGFSAGSNSPCSETCCKSAARGESTLCCAAGTTHCTPCSSSTPWSAAQGERIKAWVLPWSLPGHLQGMGHETCI